MAMLKTNLNKKTIGRWHRVQHFLGTTLALVAGALTAILLQAVISGVTARAESCANTLIPPGTYCYPMEPEEEAAIRAEMRACGSGKGCFTTRMERYARAANRLYKAGLREMHPNLRGALRGACGSQREVIRFTQCVRNSLGLGVDDVEWIQSLRSSGRTAEQVMAEEGVRANFSYSILVSVCGARPSGRCLDANLRALRNEVVSAFNNVNLSFNEMVSWSIWSYGCSERVSFNACKNDRHWNSIIMAGVDNVAYRPTHPLPGRTSSSGSSSSTGGSSSSGGGDATPSSSSSASSSDSSSSAASSSSSAGEGPNETGNGFGEGSGDGTGTGDPVQGVTGFTGLTDSSSSAGNSSSSDASSSSSGNSSSSDASSSSSGNSSSSDASSSSAGNSSSSDASSSSSGVPGGTSQSGTTGPAGPRDPRQVLSEIPLGDPNSDQPLDCSDEGMARATQLLTSRIIEARLTGQAVLYACRVQQSPELSANESARFLAQACLRVSNITRHNEAEIYLSTMVEDWFAWVDGELTRLEGLPETAGLAELRGFHVLVQRARAEGRDGMYRIMIQRNRPGSELKTGFCPWLIALNRATPGARSGFPREVVSCPAVMPAATP